MCVCVCVCVCVCLDGGGDGVGRVLMSPEVVLTHSVHQGSTALQLNTHTPQVTYVALHEGTWYMVVCCTQNAPRRQQIHVAPAMPAL